MKKISDAKKILKTLGLPEAQQNEMSALTLLALSGISKNDTWQDATQQSVTISKGIMNFIANKYRKIYAPNTRETFRRQVLHQFVQARIANYNPDNPNLPTNSPLAHYALTDEALWAIKNYGTDSWNIKVKEFIEKHGMLVTRYIKQREKNMIPVVLNDKLTLHLSPGLHNQVQVGVIQEFAPRFAPGATLLYLGDTAKKNLYLDENKLKELHIPIMNHDKLPDIVLFDSNKNWLFLVEAVTSHGPMTPKRIFELQKMLEECRLGKVYVSAFPDFHEYKQHTADISWDTEVWIMENPDHMIHYNGDRFVGPR